jgi:hypothetical protein
MPSVGASGSEENGQKEKWQWDGRCIGLYVAIFQCVEVYCALPVTKEMNFSSNKFNEQNKQPINKSVY